VSVEKEYVDNVDVMKAVDDKSVGDSVAGKVMLLNEAETTDEGDGTPEGTGVAVEMRVIFANEVVGESVGDTDSDEDAVMVVMVVALAKDVVGESIDSVTVVLDTAWVEVPVLESNPDDEAVPGTMVVSLL